MKTKKKRIAQEIQSRILTIVIAGDAVEGSILPA